MILDFPFELVERGDIESDAKVVFLVGLKGPNHFDHSGSEAGVSEDPPALSKAACTW